MLLISFYVNTLAGKMAATDIDYEHPQKECYVKGTIVKILSRYLKRLISGDEVTGGNAASLRNIIVWAFIALVAAFLTHPSEPRSALDAPVPWPAELGLDNTGI
jgi:hypothetical protein